MAVASPESLAFRSSRRESSRTASSHFSLGKPFSTLKILWMSSMLFARCPAASSSQKQASVRVRPARSKRRSKMGRSTETSDCLTSPNCSMRDRILAVRAISSMLISSILAPSRRLTAACKSSGMPQRKALSKSSVISAICSAAVSFSCKSKLTACAIVSPFKTASASCISASGVLLNTQFSSQLASCCLLSCQTAKLIPRRRSRCKKKERRSCKKALFSLFARRFSRRSKRSFSATKPKFSFKSAH